MKQIKLYYKKTDLGSGIDSSPHSSLYQTKDRQKKINKSTKRQW